MKTDRVKRSKQERDYLKEITNKYKLKTLENTSNRLDLLSNSNPMEFQSDYNTISSIATHLFLKENEPTSTTNINQDMLSESIFSSEEYQINFSQYKEKLDKKILSIKEKFKQGILFPQNVFIAKLKSINHINNKDNPLVAIIAMMHQIDLFAFISINREIKTEVLNALSFEIQTFISNKFKEMSYKELFDDYSFKIGITHLNEGVQHKISIFLIIKAKIALKKELLTKAIKIRYKSKFNCDKDLMINSFTFDIKNKPLQYWIMKEYTLFHIDLLNKAYFQHVMQFALGDYAEFTINIFTGKGLMKIKELIWLNIKTCPSPMINCYEHLKEIGDINSMRYCELELLKSDWKDIEQMQNSTKFKEIIKKRFESLFEIKNIVFDDVGYYIFKIYFTAKSSGLLGLENEIGIKVKVSDNVLDDSKNDVVSNEVKKNNLIFDRKNELQMHIGDELVFYFSKNK